MKYLNSKEVASIMGVNVSTIKRWTDSGKLDCYQTVGGHRKFLLSHVKNFLKEKINQKLKVNIIQYLNKGEKELVQRIDRIDYKYLRDYLFQLSLQQSVDSIHDVINSLLIKGEPQYRIYDELILNVLSRIGDLWSNNKLSIADEHTMTETIRNVMYRIHSEISKNNVKIPKKVICMTLTNDEHEIPLVMIQSILDEINIPSTNLGPNIPAPEIESKIQVVNPTHLIISSNYVLDTDTFNSEISQLLQICHKNDIEILIGGSGNHLLIEENRSTTIELKNMTDLFNYFKVVMES
ncbi:MAG: helix-turn-helix domain-containing protein [Candidatus Marinimicrobia bacterium]|jgi:excisionase family DNA binding protein|nr:helix-turn-helix domain-containing protein [Candidatus Neomarinimicrobiota bacterium]MBT4753405.1 helix-turn-helix domain-containing protein [Candidatus Neomarinimicrobiota bacterium]MBT5115002.1 helix-turn-helix domain-containing protein [Candidatus Neomarinimicrobiota bacterium]MBT5748826.1 helix-turn-helix domain-containing protein [Candidatus Neomarinimicrobiota bacterium]MBT6413889.1 helix-turn-helix domain-containing protein [Candidatus Neomarinimicrobiota bacterium]